MNQYYTPAEGHSSQDRSAEAGPSAQPSRLREGRRGARRTRNLFDPKSKTPFRLSRTKLDLFLSCPRCFYLDRRLGVGPAARLSLFP